ncbi:hypothetical protein Gbth_008_011 [Gluconobacter thailandicus F149-1 = NBRC 100600]|uniref:Phosphate starvation-inducible protein PsiF n=2 Tax=Gluconobacter thailandicus TaxID=257438 RepID=A0AAP9ERM6_GLUTH|nr:hypothetical protein [Gluconobacter thailandicus]KXV54850.1 hypothetical protein AD946_01285 [Gluconobacter thailandicus]QEH96071.1 hypothetical protein FXF46_07125 [Gluconobacter thailandicus]GAC88291.1 hypothetical protein NBRC3255_1952 [Gluconobacter thailandicus NBRC 3255]GAD25889.1 hypothetical protein NBRC3257_0888 [Gluconobacter thailandicus NBRC 3257]GAN92332.1 hypothetical protein Gbth_008_011 [Gluconobacter thailandicus F149-1 = NBRC 100600]
MTKTLSALAALLFATAAQAAPASTPKPSSTTPADPLAGLNMDQQMELCDRLETSKKQNKPLSPKMQQQLKACQAMSMESTPGPAPDATQDR